MRSHHFLVVTTFCSFIVLSGPAAPQGEDAKPLAFEHVDVLPMSGPTVLADQTVLIRGGRIVAIGPAAAVEVPEGSRRVDGGGRFLMPGLSEMHAHIPPQEDEAFTDRVLTLFVANGVTTIRGMLGAPHHLELRRQVADGERLGPQIFTSGPSINGRSVPTVDSARRAVTHQRAAGYDFLKIHPGVEREVFDELVALAHREGIAFAGHIPLQVGLERALLGGIASVEHLDGYLEHLAGKPAGPSQFFGFSLVDEADVSRIAEIVRATRNAGAWNTPTQVLFEDMVGGTDPEETAQRPEMRYVPASMVRQWKDRVSELRAGPLYSPERARRFLDLRRRLIRELSAAGARLLLGADTPQIFNVPGFATLREAEALVAAGLSPYEALVAGTRHPAEYLGLAAAFGTVEVGKRADLLLLEGNPLEEIGHLHRRAGVMVAGRWLPATELDGLLAELDEGPSS